MVRRLLERQELLRWVALLCMVVDHVGALLLPDLVVLRVIGRAAFPLFGVGIALNLGGRAVSVHRYIGRLLWFGLAAQVPYALAFGWDSLNIFFTLLVAVLAVGVVRGELGLWGLLGLALSPFVDYGPAGVLAVVLLCVGSRARPLIFASFVLFCVAQSDIFFGIFTAGAVLVVLGLVLVVPSAWSPPRVRWLGYGFYPTHLAALLVLGRLI